MPEVVRQDRALPAGEEARAAEIWAERCEMRRLMTNILMMLLVWGVCAAAAFALMSR